MWISNMNKAFPSHPCISVSLRAPRKHQQWPSQTKGVSLKLLFNLKDSEVVEPADLSFNVRCVPQHA